MYIYIGSRGALPPGPSASRGAAPPDPLHLGGYAPKPLHPAGLRPQDSSLGRTSGRRPRPPAVSLSPPLTLSSPSLSLSTSPSLRTVSHSQISYKMSDKFPTSSQQVSNWCPNEITNDMLHGTCER